MRTDSHIKFQEDDLLGRYNFAEEIVNGILTSFKSGQDSICIGITGEWGSGKSSILEFIANEINKQTENEQTLNVIFRFNPWLFTGQSDLQKAFLTQLGIYLRTINPQLKQLGNDIILIASIIEIANVFNPELILSKIVRSGTGILKKIGEKIAQEPSLQVLKNKIDNALEESKIKVFVIIDDIDRLIPNEIANIFRLVKLNANFKNTYFFLAFDKFVVSDALNKELKINGEQYLEKIVQIDYSIPKLTEQELENLFYSNLSVFLTNHNQTISQKDINRVWNSGFSKFFNTLRNIYRFFNALDIRYPAIKNEINILDFIVIEAIRIFDYNIYNWIFLNKEKMTISRMNYIASLLDEKSSFFDYLNSINEVEIGENSKLLINCIFNSIHLPESSFGSGRIDSDKLESEKRIAHNDFFDYYFTFKVPAKDISQSIIDKFLNSSNEERLVVLDIYKTRLSKFLKRVYFSLPHENPFDNIYKLLLDFSDKEQLHLVPDENSNRNGLSFIIQFLTDFSLKFGFNDYLTEILDSNTSYSRYYLQVFLRNRINKIDNTEPVKLFPDELLNDKYDLINDTLVKSIAHYIEIINTNPNELHITIVNDTLRYYNEINPIKYKELIENFLNDTEKTIVLFKCSLTIFLTGQTEYYSINNKKYILPELSIESFDNKLTDIKIEEYEGENIMYLKLFKKLKENDFSPTYHYSLDLEELKF